MATITEKEAYRDPYEVRSRRVFSPGDRVRVGPAWQGAAGGHYVPDGHEGIYYVVEQMPGSCDHKLVRERNGRRPMLSATAVEWDVIVHASRLESAARFPTATRTMKINAGNDRNGNPRRGWLLYDDAGVTVGFVDEGYSGTGELRRDAPEAKELGEIPTTPKFYRECLKVFGGRS